MSQRTRPTCTVIVPVFNRSSLTGACLRALFATKTTVPYEVIVIDDASHDSSESTLHEFEGQIRVVRHDANSGFAMSCNDGAAEADSDYLIFLNNDVFPENGWLDQLVRYADANPAAAVIGTKLLYPNGTVQHAGIVISQERFPRHIYSGIDAMHPAVNKSREFQCVTAAAVLIRADAFATAGGFDASFKNGYEDIDLCLRLRETGAEVHYCHTSVLRHLETATREFDYYDFNHALYLERWGDRVRPDDLDYYLEDGFLSLEYGNYFPFRLHVDPSLAVIDDGQRTRQSEELIATRSRQFFDLLRENTHLKVQLQELAPTAEAFPGAVAPHPEDQSTRGDGPLLFLEVADPVVSIVIPVHNQWRYTLACLHSLRENTPGPPYEVIIADDASSDETRKMSDQVRNVRVIRQSHARGFLHNCNGAARHARGRYLVFLNNDTKVELNWLQPLIHTFEDPAVGIVGPKLVYPTGRLQEAGGIIWSDGTGWNYGRLDDPARSEYNYVREVDYVSAACLVIHRPLFEEIGGFDTRYAPAYYEDTDLAFEARRRGRTVLYQPGSTVIHYEGVSHGTNEEAGVKSIQPRNREIFVAKWHHQLEEHHEPGRDPLLARDRPQHRPTILVVDHHVPQYDQDAGGRSTYHYLKLFVDLGWRVVFLPGNFYPQEPYTHELQQLGITVLYGDWYSKNFNVWLRENGQYFDLVQLHRPHVAWRFVESARAYAHRAKLAYVPHDLHYLRELRRYESEGDREAVRAAEDWWKLEFDLFAKVDIIQLFNRREEEAISAAFPLKTVQTIPLFISEENETPNPAPFDARRNLLFVGGFGHPPNADALSWFVSEILSSVREELPEVRLRVVGSRPPREVMELAGPHISIEGYVPDAELARLYQRSRVAIAPLRFGAGLKGKIVEAMAAGLPVVTTSIGAEGIGNGNGQLAIADDPVDFASAVVDLYSSETAWERASISGRRYIQTNFSRTVATRQIRSAFGL
jgi:GT2 family glycosyltransferase/glycosyltransferase involved in cell wall biosynthesis